MRRNGPKTLSLKSPHYLTKNKYISLALFQDLVECTKHLRMHNLVTYMEILGVADAVAWTDRGKQVVMEDLETIYGEYAYGDMAGPIHFYAGPGKSVVNESCSFAVIKSNALNWCLDRILHKVVSDGYDIFDKLGIPL